MVIVYTTSQRTIAGSETDAFDFETVGFEINTVN